MFSPPFFYSFVDLPSLIAALPCQSQQGSITSTEALRYSWKPELNQRPAHVVRAETCRQWALPCCTSLRNQSSGVRGLVLVG